MVESGYTVDPMMPQPHERGGGTLAKVMRLMASSLEHSLEHIRKTQKSMVRRER